MSSLWLYLTLLYATSFVQNRVSSKSGVSLKCNESVEVEAGETATLNCTITYSGIDEQQDCKAEHYSWNNIDFIPCSSGLIQDNVCDYVTYVLLTIANVRKNENYTARIVTNCGRATSSPIEVQVFQRGDDEPMEPSNSTHDGETRSTHVPVVFFGIFVIFIVSCMLYFLFRTNRGREIMKRIKKKLTHEAHSDMHHGVQSH